MEQNNSPLPSCKSSTLHFGAPCASRNNAWRKSDNQVMALPRLKTVITRERFYKTAVVLFFHGEEGSAQAVKDNLKCLLHKHFDFDHIRIIYPQAPEIPYTVEGKELRSVWFDRKTYSPTCPEQKDSIERSCSLVKQLVNDLVMSGTNKERIVLGGLDMGAQLAMHVGYRYLPEVAGIFGLSTYLTPTSSVFQHILKQKQANKDVKFPKLLLCNDHDDKKVTFKWASLTAECFMDLNIESEFQVYYGTEEGVSLYELVNLRDWILDVLPDESLDNRDKK